MKQTLAFDIYGTLIDTNGVVKKLSETIGGNAGNFSLMWRNKQLEYTFRRGLMGKYTDFSVCTRQALDWVCDATKTNFSETQKNELIELYKILPAFPDVKNSLSQLAGPEFRIFAFSNGSATAVKNLLDNAGLSSFFEGVVSVESLRMFKPSPIVYEHFLKNTQSNCEQTWLISSNSFDVIGALAVGMKSVWVNRSPGNPMDPWEFSPTAVITDLNELQTQLNKHATTF